MMQVSQKCQYALRAVYELAKRYGQRPLSGAEIARVQAIPPKFLELILRELRQAGFVESRRGPQGGYLLVEDPRQLAVGQVIRQIEGPFTPVSCLESADESLCPLKGRCAFSGCGSAHARPLRMFLMTRRSKI